MCVFRPEELSRSQSNRKHCSRIVLIFVLGELNMGVCVCVCVAGVDDMYEQRTWIERMCTAHKRSDIQRVYYTIEKGALIRIEQTETKLKSFNIAHIPIMVK